jgi:hypothetical protein
MKSLVRNIAGVLGVLLISTTTQATLTGSVETPGTGTRINLTTEGTADWAYWTATSLEPANSKAGADDIGPLTTIGNLGIQNNTSQTGWDVEFTDGTDPASGSADNLGCRVRISSSPSRDEGFRLTVKAGAAPRVLKLYCHNRETPSIIRATLGNDVLETEPPYRVTGDMGDFVYTLEFSHPTARELVVEYLCPAGASPTYTLRIGVATLSGELVFERNRAYDESPSDGATDVPADVVLGWSPLPSAGTRNVYLGTSFDDVSAANLSSPLGVLAKAGLDVNSYDPPGLLEFGTTYYWRVDEVNATADHTVFQGSVWSFTVEPYAYQLTGVTATASSSSPNMGPEKTIDGSGLDAAGLLHGTTDTTMWLSDPAGPKPAWIEYQFDRVYKLDQMWVWNSNQSLEPFAGIGARNVTIEYATDANDWQVLAGVPEFTRAPGMAGYAHDTTVDFGGVAASKVRLTINSNWGTLPQTGLSEVRFFHVPVRAREPQPVAGATNVNPNNLTLRWRSGREAVSHEVFLSTDANAVANGSALIDTTSTDSYGLNGLDLGTTYSWRIDEVNQAASPPLWQGDVWSFSTPQYLVIDDFESYTNDSPNRLFQTWIDGIGFSADDFFPADNPGNNSGSAVGHDIWTAGTTHTTIAETSIIHGGRQSMPLYYDNSSFACSEADRIWKTPQNWTTNGADTLNLYFRGNPIGFLELSPSHILMNGTGTDIWGTADQGRFVYKQLTGDGTIIARVDRLDNTNEWAKAGVMIRNSPDAASSWALIVFSSLHGAHFQARLTTGGTAVSDTTLTLPAEQTGTQIPTWVKLERRGDQFYGYYATGETVATWTPIPWNPQTIPMNSTVGIGLAVTSHAAGAVTQAEFSGIETTGDVTGSWQSVSLGVDQPAGNLPDTLYVRLEDGSHTATAVNSDSLAVGAGVWTQWSIPLSTFTSAGVQVDKITKMVIGVGDKTKPASGATGLIYIDDIGFGRSASQ